MTGQRSYGSYKEFGFLRLEFVLILAVLACVPRAGAQTLNSSQVDNSRSSSNLSNLASGKRVGSGFGALDAGVSDVVDASLQGSGGSIKLDISLEFAGGLAGSGRGGKTSATVQKLLAEGSVPGMSSQGVQDTRFRGLRGSSGLLQKGIAYSALTGVTAPKLNAADALSQMMQSDSPTDTGEQEPASEGEAAKERITSLSGLEGMGDAFKASQNTSFESLCTLGCGGPGNLGPVEGRRNIENSEQALARHLSRSTTRLSLSNLASDSKSGRFFGRLPGGESELPGESWSAAQLSVGGGSNDQR